MSRRSMSFEASLERLEEIVSLLERGDAPLAEALKLFQEGTNLVRSCSSQLEKAELEVVKLSRATDGTVKEEALIDENAE